MTPKEERIPPGPRLPALVQTAMLLRDPVGFLERCRERYGSIFRVRFLGFPRYVYVGDPAVARQVYAEDRGVGLAGEARREFLAPLVGESSLLCLEGDEWLRHRKLLGPAFHTRHVDGYRDEIAQIAGERIEQWPAGEPFELRPRMQEITLEVIIRLIFGIKDAERLGRLRALLEELVEAAGSPVMLFATPLIRVIERYPAIKRLPANPVSRFLRARDETDAIIYDEIRRRGGGGDDANDVLTLLLGSRDEDGRPMDEAELRDELITLLEAGHETTATALAWTFERLTRSPEVLGRLTSELDEGGDEYLDAVAREALRSRPVILDTPRVLSGPLEVGGYKLTAGWWIAPAIPLVHSAAAPDSQEFRPERFLEGDPPRDGWIPFGGGKRHCVGSHLALLELKVVIAEVLRRVELEAVRPADEDARIKHVTLVPSELGRVIARRRTREPAGAPA